jgi:hypothetical protein
MISLGRQGGAPQAVELRQLIYAIASRLRLVIEWVSNSA